MTSGRVPHQGRSGDHHFAERRDTPDLHHEVAGRFGGDLFLNQQEVRLESFCQSYGLLTGCRLRYHAQVVLEREELPYSKAKNLFPVRQKYTDSLWCVRLFHWPIGADNHCALRHDAGILGFRGLASRRPEFEIFNDR